MKKFNELSDDIRDKEFETIYKRHQWISNWEILDIFGDPKDIPVKEGFRINTDLSVKSVKRGDYVWITSIIEKTRTWNFTSPSVQVLLN